MTDRLTPLVEAAIVNALRRGCTYELAARAAGVARVTLWYWLRKGKKSRSGKFRDFLNIVRRAEAEALAACAARVMDAIDQGDVRAACWFLERRAPEEYGPLPVKALDRRLRVLERSAGGDAKPGPTARSYRERAST
jgi:hypothetical protein